MKKFLITFFIIIFLIVLDIILYRYLTIYGLRANIWLIYVIFASLFLGHKESVLLGFFCGMVFDILHLTIFGINTLALSTIGYIFGWLHKRINESLLRVQILTLFCGSVLYLLLTFVISKIFYLPTTFSLVTSLAPFVDLFLGLILIRTFIWIYKSSRIIS